MAKPTFFLPGVIMTFLIANQRVGSLPSATFCRICDTHDPDALDNCYQNTGAQHQVCAGGCITRYLMTTSGLRTQKECTDDATCISEWWLSSSTRPACQKDNLNTLSVNETCSICCHAARDGNVRCNDGLYSPASTLVLYPDILRPTPSTLPDEHPRPMVCGNCEIDRDNPSCGTSTVCSGSKPLCMTSFYSDGNNNLRQVKRCAAVSECWDLWYNETRLHKDCMGDVNNDPYSWSGTKSGECHYCCHTPEGESSDWCNKAMWPTKPKNLVDMEDFKRISLDQNGTATTAGTASTQEETIEVTTTESPATELLMNAQSDQDIDIEYPEPMVCGDCHINRDNPACDASTECDGLTPLCMTSFYSDGQSKLRQVKRCAAVSECWDLWYNETRLRKDCMGDVKNDPYSWSGTKSGECHYCCHTPEGESSDWCNKAMWPTKPRNLVDMTDYERNVMDPLLLKVNVTLTNKPEEVTKAQTTEQAATEEVTGVQTTEQAATEEVTEEQTTEQTATEKVTDAQTTEQSATEDVTDAQTTEQAATEDVTEAQTTEQAATEDVTEPQTTEQTATEDMTEEQTTGQADTEDVTRAQTTEQAATEDVTEEQTTEQAATEAVTEAQTTEQAATEEVTEEQSREQAATEEVTEEQTTEQTATEDVTEAQTTEQAATEDVTEPQTTEQTATEDVTEEQTTEQAATEDVTRAQTTEQAATEDVTEEQTTEQAATEDVTEVLTTEHATTEEVTEAQTTEQAATEDVTRAQTTEQAATEDVTEEQTTEQAATEEVTEVLTTEHATTEKTPIFLVGSTDYIEPMVCGDCIIDHVKNPSCGESTLCNGSEPLCMTSFYSDGQNNLRQVKRCAAVSECWDLWYNETRLRKDCMGDVNNDPYSWSGTKSGECHYCCHTPEGESSDWCNKAMWPTKPKNLVNMAVYLQTTPQQRADAQTTLLPSELNTDEETTELVSTEKQVEAATTIKAETEAEIEIEAAKPATTEEVEKIEYTTEKDLTAQATTKSVETIETQPAPVPRLKCEVCESSNNQASACQSGRIEPCSDGLDYCINIVSFGQSQDGIQTTSISKKCATYQDCVSSSNNIGACSGDLKDLTSFKPSTSCNFCCNDTSPTGVPCNANLQPDKTINFPIKSVAAPVSSRSCVQCGDPASGKPCGPGDLLLGTSQVCPAGLDFCMNDIYEKAGVGKTIFKRCVDEAECKNKWFKESSDSPECTEYNPRGPVTSDLTCHFCCTSDGCNIPTKPVESTLWTPFFIGG